MLDFVAEDHRLILTYRPEVNGSYWLYSELANGKPVTLRRTFIVTSDELISEESESDEFDAVWFEIGTKEGEYYRLSKNVLGIENDLFLHESLKLTPKTFIAERNISVFSKLDRLSLEPIRIGGPDESAIPEEALSEILKKFPTSYELTKYASARISAVLSSYLKTKQDYEERYQHYMNRRASVEGTNTYQLVKNAEIEKYTLLLSQLRNMLQSESSYSEAQWQTEILQIVLLLYPKYLHVFPEVSIRDTYNKKDRRIDFLLVDAQGNADIIEIKKPFDKCIVTNRTYRDNFIPLRELSGTVMQIEKYIFYLNKWGMKGEEILTNRFRDQLGEGCSIKITNPGAIIMMGRENELTVAQLQDFEVIKRKYKNIVDIITYDDLLRRLQTTLQHWQSHA